MEVHEELWPRPELFDVGPFWSFLYGLQVYSLSPDAPEWLQIEHAWQEMAHQGYPKLVTFLKIIGDTDPYCFTEQQKIVIWRHEEPDNREPIQYSFSECLMADIRELEARKNRKDAAEDKKRRYAVATQNESAFLVVCCGCYDFFDQLAMRPC